MQMTPNNPISQSSLLALDRYRTRIRIETRRLTNESFPWEDSVFDWTKLCSEESHINLRRERDALIRWITEVFWDRPTAFCSLTFPNSPSMETVRHSAQKYLNRVIQKLPSSSYTDNPRRIVSIHTAPKNHLHILFELPKDENAALYVRKILADLWIKVVTDKGRMPVTKYPSRKKGITHKHCPQFPYCDKNCRGKIFVPPKPKKRKSPISKLADVEVVPNTADGVDMSHQQEMRRIVAQY